jgi:hypothetical protein
MPLGFEEGDNAPAWYVNASSFEEAGGEAIGELGSGQANVGQVSLGEGNVTMIGALLPNPTEEHYHPYGLDDYATTYTGNQLVRNALDWELTADRTPRENTSDPAPIAGEDGAGDEQLNQASADGEASSVPLGGLVAVLAALGAALVAIRRPRSR